MSKPKVNNLPSQSNYEVKAAIEQAKVLAQDATAYDFDEVVIKPQQLKVNDIMEKTKP